jgi:hypothetical protein
MTTFERRILAELRRLHEAEAALEATYESLRGSGVQAGRSFLASLKSLDERVNQFESFLERVA